MLHDLKDTLRLSAECGFCGTSNELIVNFVTDSHEVRCSHCGAPLGSIGDLRHQAHQAAAPASRRTSSRQSHQV
jgi:hypothetical protein